jgi:hypothetical protein
MKCGEMFDGQTGFCDGNVVPGLDGQYSGTWQECHDICRSNSKCNMFMYWPAHATPCFPKTRCDALQGSYPAKAYSRTCPADGPPPPPPQVQRCNTQACTARRCGAASARTSAALPPAISLIPPASRRGRRGLRRRRLAEQPRPHLRGGVRAAQNRAAGLYTNVYGIYALSSIRWF